MTNEAKERAIRWLTEEVRSLRLAPTVNGCKPDNWAESLEVMETCLEAVKAAEVAGDGVRPIDANATIEALRANFQQGSWYGCEDPLYQIAEDTISEMPTICTGRFPDTTKMLPLTLEQLREMDGQPVWIVDIGPHKWYGPGWAIVDRDNCLVRTAKNWNSVFFERYGERWLAYRRPPEGEEDTHDPR